MAGRTYIIGSFNVRNLSMNTTNRIPNVCEIIKKENMDLVALQEVLLSEKDAVDLFLGHMGRDKWDMVCIKPKLSRTMSAVDKDLREEKYAFIWNKDRLKKVDTKLNGGQLRVYEPRIFTQYKLNPSLGQKPLVRNPLYGRFTPRDLGGGNFEIRVICTHIRFNGQKGDDDSSFVNMRRNELDVLARTLYPKLSDRIYGDMMPAYTILLGDYNMNLRAAGPGMSSYIDAGEKKLETVEVTDGARVKKITTFQSDKTTLKRKQSEDEDVLDDKYANNYDHFTYDELRVNSIHPKYQAVDVIHSGKYGRYLNDFKRYREEVSDHIPIIIKLTPNENDL